MTRCLVVGGNGFIGSHVVDELARLGHEVGVYDRFSTGRTRYDATEVRQHTGDFLDAESVTRAVSGYEVIYHLATSTTPATASADPLLDVRTNVIASVELLRAAAAADVRHVYFASSGGTIYGSIRDHAAREDDPTVPVSPYGIGKLTVERYLEFFHLTTGMNWTSFRIANAYGPRQHARRLQGVIPIFLRQILAGEPLHVLGDGSMARDYIYVNDVARQLVRPLETDAPHHIYNIGSGVATTINEVLDVVREVVQRDFTTVRNPVPSTFVERIALDTSRFRADFGETTSLSLHEGIERTWESIA